MRRIKEAMAKVRSYHIEFERLQTAEREAKETVGSMIVHGDVASNGDYQMLGTMEAPPIGFSLTTSLRRIGKVAYVKSSMGPDWMTAEEGNLNDYPSPLEMPLELRDVPELEALVVELQALDGEVVYRISGTAIEGPQGGEVTIWAGIADLLVRQWEMQAYVPADSAIGPTERQEVYQRTLYRYGRYDEPVTVQVPGPAPPPTPMPTFVPVTTANRIAFASDRDGNMNIYVMNADGSNQARLTNHPEADVEPAWSPDGSRIVFGCYRDNNLEICVMEADGSNQTRLTHNNTLDSMPAWSPDGSRIAFESYRDGLSEIYVMNADGSNQTRLTHNNATDWMHVWSPDGSRIAFVSERDGNMEVYAMEADGSKQTRLSENNGTDWAPAWSPDGSRIAFESERGGSQGVYVMEADGSKQRRLTDGDVISGQPAWSPDGSHIAFLSYKGGIGGIWLMEADGSKKVRLTGSLGDILPAWSSDGSRIAFISGRDLNMEIYVIDADGSNLARLTDNYAMDWEFAWSPVAVP